MTICILKRVAGQKIARPFNRASTISELKEILGWAAAWHMAGDKMSDVERYRFANSRASDAEEQIIVSNLDTDEPLFVSADVEFFAFMER